jgi:dihydrofolate reductase (trimethoprim resistance protein)
MSDSKRSPILWAPAKPSPAWKWGYGERVRKKAGSSWQGRVVGFYQTHLTPEGYAIESEREPGSVQIYPAAALEEVQS